MGIRGIRPGAQVVAIKKEKRVNDGDEHRNLCLLAGKWLHKTGRTLPASCPYVAVEMATAGQENPDVFGWNYWTSVLIEVKVSRSDFIADSKKPFRQNPESGIGEHRYYCCPNGLISINEIPPKWGLLYEIKGVINVIKKAETQTANGPSERAILSSIMRRQGIRKQVFDYKK
jgi:hypothetical protein